MTTASRAGGSFQEAETVVVVDSQPAMFPGVVATPAGLLTSFSTVPDGMPGGQVGVVESTDGGRSWGQPRIVVQPRDGDEAALNQIGLRRLSNGDLLMPFCRIRLPGGYAHRQATLHLARSTDEAVTWSIGDPLDVEFQEPLTYGAIVEPAPGDLLLPVWGRRREGEHWRSTVLHSLDYGHSWDRAPVTIGYDAHALLRTDYARPAVNAMDEHGQPAFENISDPTFRPHADVDGFTETAIVALTEARLLAVLRQQGVGGDEELWFYRSESRDGGRNWSAPQRLSLAGTSPALHLTRRGDLLLAYRVFAPDGSGIDPGVHLASSSDNGHSWQYELALSDAKGYRWTSEYQCGYPDIVELDDGVLLLVFYSYDPDLPHRRYLTASRLVLS